MIFPHPVPKTLVHLHFLKKRWQFWLIPPLAAAYLASPNFILEDPQTLTYSNGTTWESADGWSI